MVHPTSYVDYHQLPHNFPTHTIRWIATSISQVVVKETKPLWQYMDLLVPIMAKNVKHRATLSRQTRSARDFDRNRVPGILSRDIDFAENMNIEVRVFVVFGGRGRCMGGCGVSGGTEGGHYVSL